MKLRSVLPALWARLRAHLFPAAANRDVDEEIAYHLDRETERNVARGLSAAAARAAALRAFGNLAQTGEAMREAPLWSALDRLQRDLGQACRSLRRSPSFSLTVILTIALALGLNATVFTIFNAYVLRPLAVRDPGALYTLTAIITKGPERFPDSWLDWRDFESLRDGNPAFSDVLGSRATYVRIEQTPSMGELVTGNYFGMLGVGAILGRPLVPDDAAARGDGAVLVLSHRVWRQRFGGDSGVVGTTLHIRGYPFTIVGVIGPRFTGVSETASDFWAPVSALDRFEEPGRGRAGAPPRLGVIGRLRPGVSKDGGERLLEAWAKARAPVPSGEQHLSAVRLAPKSTAVPLSGELVLVFAPIAGAFLLVMGLACANVANMMLARGVARQREIGIRLALGAGRSRVVRQLLTEAVVLALPAAAIGYVFSRATISLGVRWIMATIPTAFSPYIRMVPLEPDLRVFGFMMVAAAGSAILFGLAPALQATRPGVVRAVRGEFDGRAPARFRNALVVAQIAGCLVLLVAAGVLLRTSGRVSVLAPGFRTEGIVVVDVNERLRGAALARLRLLPGVISVAAAASPPADGAFPVVAIGAVGRPQVSGVHFNRVSPGYFSDLGIPLVAGRTYSEREARGAEPVALVSLTAAARLFGRENPLGRDLRLEGDDAELAAQGLRPFRTVKVIGMVADAQAGCACTSVASAVVYFPVDVDRPGTRLLVSAAGPSGPARQALDETMARLEPGALEDLHTLDEAVAVQAYPFRAAHWVSSALGGVALILMLTGIYGVLSCLVTQRAREIGIRMALGARAPNVVGLVLRQSLRMGALGGVIGLVVALGVSRLFASQLDVLNTFDPLAYFGSAALAIGVCLTASWLPARRAARVDPVETLRRD